MCRPIAPISTGLGFEVLGTSAVMYRHVSPIFTGTVGGQKEVQYAVVRVGEQRRCSMQ